MPSSNDRMSDEGMNSTELRSRHLLSPCLLERSEVSGVVLTAPEIRQRRQKPRSLALLGMTKRSVYLLVKPNRVMELNPV